MYVNTFILKGVGGLAACASVAVPGVVFREPIGKYLKNKFFPESQEALMEKVGLGCGIPSAQGSDCSKRGTNNIKAKKGDDNTIEVSGISNGKIKLYKAQESEGYFKNLKFVIEEGDIDSTTTGKKLEQFETYEIKNEGENYYLSRKTETKDEIKRVLGLPSDCNLPTESSSPTTCDDLELEKMKLLAFEERGGDSPTLTGKVKLTIAKLTSNDSLFPFGYKFSFQGKGSDATLNWTTGSKTISFKSGVDTEYRIKKNDGNLITLEEAWNQNTLTDRVGLSCTGGVPTTTNAIDCVRKNGDGVKIKAKKDTTTFDLDNISQGKIKLYKAEDSEGYFKNLKFVIEGGDISGTDTNKLEQFETYEIKKDTGDDWRLTRKTEAKDGIKKALGLGDCQFPTTTGQEGCDISGDKFKKIKFEDRGGAEGESVSGVKLKITSESSSQEFPLGFKFVLDSSTDTKISGSLTIKGSTNTEFKIKKKSADNNDITLERAWTVTTLGQKINLTCPDAQGQDEKKCSLGASINVHESNSNKVSNASFQNGDSSKKITYEDKQPNYNQGFKFYTSEDINLQGSSGVSKIEKKEGDTGTSYEIKQDTDGTWYLFKKAGAART